MNVVCLYNRDIVCFVKCKCMGAIFGLLSKKVVSIDAYWVKISQVTEFQPPLPEPCSHTQAHKTVWETYFVIITTTCD